MRSPGFFAGALCALSALSNAAADPAFSCAGVLEVHTSAAAKPLNGARKFLPSKGRLHVLVVYAHFQDEAPSPVSDLAEKLFDPDLPGSFSHFYHTMSFGQLQVESTVLPKRYTSDRPASSYLAKAPGGKGRFDLFALEVLQKVDADIDFGRFDSDGPDELPDSGDDDGVVDYIFLLLRSVPPGFLLGSATGIAGLGLGADYLSADLSSRGDPLHISGLVSYGAVLREGAFAYTVGSMAHEFGHGLGLPDLYDTSFLTAPGQPPSEDSAGIGKWGLMGLGALGWNGDGGPNSFCAWSLEQLGWIGPDSERLVELSADTPALEIADLHQGGYIYKIPLPTTFIPGELIYTQEYLLLEHRERSSHYYNRHLPSEGLLVWHIRSHVSNNDQEETKLVDLICADGLYAGAGYPLDQIADPRGGDNLDFWAHDPAYTAAHGGNPGDATDPFDGMRFTRFALDTNPSTRTLGFPLADAATGAAIENIRRRGAVLVADVAVPHWAGVIREPIHWLGEILVDGDLTIAPEGRLIVHDNTRVRFAGTDRLGSGADPVRCELYLQGALRVLPSQRKSPYTEHGIEVVETKTAVFEALVPGETWYGILLSESARLQVPADLVLRDAEHGLLAAGVQYALQATAVRAEAAPSAFRLLPNFPNPFNGETAIRYLLPEASWVRLTIYNALGQQMRLLEEGIQEAGERRAMWDGQDGEGREVAGGAYFCRLEVEGQPAVVQPMALVR